MRIWMSFLQMKDRGMNATNIIDGNTTESLKKLEDSIRFIGRHF